MVGDEEVMPTSGVLMSPNYPEEYPYDLDLVQRIQVPEGNTIWIQFTDFTCEPRYDTVTVTDRDGTRLGLFDGQKDSADDWQTKIISNTDAVEVRFQTDDGANYEGWRLEWGT